MIIGNEQIQLLEPHIKNIIELVPCIRTNVYRFDKFSL